MNRALAAVVGIVAVCLGVWVWAADPKASEGVLPLGADGRPLNLDFETGTLKDWTATGDAFAGQPIKGDAVAARRKDMRSQHQGNYWIGSFETAGDKPTGSLTSATFKVTHPWAAFLVAGGSSDQVRVEIVSAADKAVIFKTSGGDTENLGRAVVDLQKFQGKDVFIRLIDDHTGPWGHLNFDDFRFYGERPKFAAAAVAKAKAPAGPPLPADVVKFNGLTPQEAVKAITLTDGFSATLFAGEPEIVQPVAFTIDDRGRLWVAEAMTYPKRAPEGEGKDRIVIFEDIDGDGKADKRTVFAEGLNLVSGLEVGFGGVWVGAAPYLMFIPDKDGDDKPDGPPQILLDGFGYTDTHETLNAFTWGPDGWLYGCHGVFVKSAAGKPGTPAAERTPITAGVWRYHPTKHVFELFAEGTSNPWGVDFNDMGQAFCTACVIPHLYHMIQGGRFQRQAGSHFDPYTYKDITTIADHVHWAGTGGPHAGNNRSDAAGGGHAHAGAMIYLGGAWPAEYRNTIFMSNIHGNRVNNDLLEPQGSGYVGKHGKDLLLMNDKWSRLINLKYGPDGSVYMIDWYDQQACHLPQPEKFDRSNGRIYKVSYKASEGRGAGAAKGDLSKLSNAELVALQGDANEYFVRHARRILQERQSKDVTGALGTMLNVSSDPAKRLRALWALHALGADDEKVLMGQLRHANEYVRGWAIQLACEDRNPSDEMLAEFARLAESDPSPVVRLYLASALQRIDAGKRWDILKGLVAHEADADDHNLPCMYWYALEPLVGVDKIKALKIAGEGKVPMLREFVARKMAGGLK
ncbi:MAG: putative rane-bound dehydrogenase [Phycisphaerales bacterium]|nr:putative rane-bound dehydrogenase [Phycisphaerales bacterium]